MRENFPQTLSHFIKRNELVTSHFLKIDFPKTHYNGIYQKLCSNRSKNCFEFLSTLDNRREDVNLNFVLCILVFLQHFSSSVFYNNFFFTQLLSQYTDLPRMLY